MENIKFKPCDNEDCQVCCDHGDELDHGICIDCGWYEHDTHKIYSACGQER